MSRVNRDHRTAALFSLVREKCLELRERPAMQASLGGRFALRLCPSTNVGEPFENQSASRLDARGKLLRQDMITVASKPGLGMPHAAQVPFRALRSTLLQGTLEAEVAAFGGFPCLLTQEAIGRGDGGVCKSQIHADDFWRGSHVWRGHCDHDMQPPAAVPLDQVRRIDRETRIATAPAWDSKTQG
jgi:hypothetical protein